MADIARESSERLKTVVTALSDPTATAPQFAFTQNQDRPSTWTAGTWEGTYSSGRATALTPTVGGTGTGAAVKLEVGAWYAWIKITATPDSPVLDCGTVMIK